MSSLDLKSRIYCLSDFSTLAKYSSRYRLSSSLSIVRSWIFLLSSLSPSSNFLLLLLISRVRFSILMAFSKIYSFSFLICLSMNWLFYFRLDNTPLVLDFYNYRFEFIYLISLFLVSYNESKVLVKVFISLIFYSIYLS